VYHLKDLFWDYAALKQLHWLQPGDKMKKQKKTKQKTSTQVVHRPSPSVPTTRAGVGKRFQVSLMIK